MAFSVSAFGLNEEDLPPGWIADRLDTLAFLNPEQISSGYSRLEIAYLDIANVAAGAIGKPAILSLADAPSRAKRIVKSNDTILSTVRPGNRSYAFLQNAPDNLIASTGFAVLRPKPGAADPRFVYYLATGDPIINYLASIAEEKTAYPSVNPSDIAECVVPIPPLLEQRAIAHILGVLDDKIELNRQLNETLELMARTVFKSWFLDFSPVRANAEGRRPAGMDPEVAALFPCAFVESELGEIPKGWCVEGFVDHLLVERGLSYAGEGLRENGTGLPMHNLNSVYEGGGYKHEGIKYYDGEYRDRHLLKPGDLIVTNTEQGFDHLLIGHAAIVPDCFGPIGLFSHHIYRVRPLASSPLTPQYLAHLINSSRYHYWISGFSNGTTINMLPMDALEMPSLVVPPAELLVKFTALSESCHARIEANLQESRTLAALRDELLPKLLSGELRLEPRNRTENWSTEVDS